MPNTLPQHGLPLHALPLHALGSHVGIASSRLNRLGIPLYGLPLNGVPAFGIPGFDHVCECPGFAIALGGGYLAAQIGGPDYGPAATNPYLATWDTYSIGGSIHVAACHCES